MKKESFTLTGLPVMFISGSVQVMTTNQLVSTPTDDGASLPWGTKYVDGKWVQNDVLKTISDY